jgi:general secretion pathway protein I
VRRANFARADLAPVAGAASWSGRSGFTLLEVMIAVAFIGIAMLALLSLHQNNLESVIRAQDLTRASMLAQQVMSTAEVERFPTPGQTRGDFSHDYPGEFSNFRWERDVDVITQFPDICRVRVSIMYGHHFDRRFDLVEFMHNPTPPQLPEPNGAANSGAGDSQGDSSQ